MSKRRAAGEWVRPVPGAGMVGEADRLLAQIQPEPEKERLSCIGLCLDPYCREWATLWTESDPRHDGKRHALYHVSECQMSDPEVAQ